MLTSRWQPVRGRPVRSSYLRGRDWSLLDRWALGAILAATWETLQPVEDEARSFVTRLERITPEAAAVYPRTGPRLIVVTASADPVWNGERLQLAIDVAQPGDTIQLTAQGYACAVSYERSVFILPQKTPVHGDSRDTITITTDGALPPLGTRIVPSTHYPAMARLVATGDDSILRTPEAGQGTTVKFWTLRGLDLVADPAVDAKINFGILLGVDGTPLADLLTGIEGFRFQQLWIHASEHTPADYEMKVQSGLRYGLSLSGTDHQIVDSHIQAGGPRWRDNTLNDGVGINSLIASEVLVDNNWIECSYNTFFFGGSDAPALPEHTYTVTSSTFTDGRTSFDAVVSGTTDIPVDTLLAFRIFPDTDYTVDQNTRSRRWAVGIVTAWNSGTRTATCTPRSDTAQTCADATVTLVGNHAQGATSISVDGLVYNGVWDADTWVLGASSNTLRITGHTSAYHVQTGGTFTNGALTFTVSPGLEAAVNDNTEMTFLCAASDNQGYQDFWQAPMTGVGSAAQWGTPEDSPNTRNWTISGNAIHGYPDSLAYLEAGGAILKAFCEHKNGDGILWEGNYFYSSISGPMAIVPSNQDGAYPWASVTSVTWRYNWFQNYSGNVWAMRYPYHVSGNYAHDITFNENVCELSNDSLGYGVGRFFRTFHSGLSNIQAQHNTVVPPTSGTRGSQWMVVSAPVPPATIKNNVVFNGTYGANCNVSPGTGNMGSSCFSPSLIVCSHNLVVDDADVGLTQLRLDYNGDSQLDTPTRVVADFTDIDFSNYAGRDYRLLATSPGYQTGSDSLDMGVSNWAAFAAAMSPGDYPVAWLGDV